jgi:hypothetical protein
MPDSVTFEINYLIFLIVHDQNKIYKLMKEDFAEVTTLGTSGS